MRKIELNTIQTLRLFRGMKPGSEATATYDNTTLSLKDQVVTVTLHGHRIARITSKEVTFTLAGWDTLLTRGRLHRLLWELCNVRVSRHKGQTYFETQDGSRKAMHPQTEYTVRIK
jgi:hypothetical protein